MASNQEQVESFATEQEQDMPASEEARDSGDEDMIEFWNAQTIAEPPKEDTQIEEGPLKIQRIEDISAAPTELPTGIEWCTLDPTNDEEMNDLWELLNGQYVEDDDAMFRFNYSKSILRWYVFTALPFLSLEIDRGDHQGIDAPRLETRLAYRDSLLYVTQIACVHLCYPQISAHPDQCPPSIRIQFPLYRQRIARKEVDAYSNHGSHEEV